MSNPGFSIFQAGIDLVGFKIESRSKSFKGILAEKSILFPSGDHLGLAAPYLNLVICLASPPSMESEKICVLSPTKRLNAIVFPSGLQTGLEALSVPYVNCFGTLLPSVLNV